WHCSSDGCCSAWRLTDEDVDHPALPGLRPADPAHGAVPRPRDLPPVDGGRLQPGQDHGPLGVRRPRRGPVGHVGGGAGAGAARAATLAQLLPAGYVLIQKAGLDWIPWRDSNNLPPTFPVGTMGNSNFAGGYLAVAAPLFAYVVLSARTRYWRLVLWGAFAL